MVPAEIESPESVRASEELTTGIAPAEKDVVVARKSRAFLLAAEPRPMEDVDCANAQLDPEHEMPTSAGPEVVNVIAGPVAVPPAMRVFVATMLVLNPASFVKKDRLFGMTMFSFPLVEVTLKVFAKVLVVMEMGPVSPKSEVTGVPVATNPPALPAHTKLLVTPVSCIAAA